MACCRRPCFWITLFGLLFFAPLVLHPTRTLYSDCSDLLTLLLPYKRFLVSSFQETGQLALWIPFNFAGIPFAHDLSASVFYPLHWPLLFLPESWLGAAISWLVVLHVMVAGWCMHAYARHQGLSGAGALVAAIGYMFAGKGLLHILGGGHYNMVVLAWLPLVLLWLEQAIQHGSLVRATWAGAAYALIILGSFPYVTLYAGVFVAVWTLGTALEESGYWGRGDDYRTQNWRGLWRWVGFGAWTALIAVGLAAVQLLPALEATAEASRCEGVGLSAEYFLNGFRALVGMVGPPLSNEPNAWENRAGLGVLWLLMIVLAPRLGGPRLRFQGWVYLGLVVFALGGAALVQWLPGFRLFRLPSRMFLVAALPAALLTGQSIQALVTTNDLNPESCRRYRGLLLKLTGLVLFLAAAFAITLHTQRSDLELQVHPYWFTLLATIPCAYWLLARPRPTLWVVILAVDLCSLTWPLVKVRSDAEVYEPSACIRYLETRRGEHGRVLDFNPEDTSANQTPLWPGLPAVQRIEPIRGFNPVDILRYKEYLQFLTDEDEPLRPIDGMFTGPILGTFAIKNQSLADLLGIRFLLQPSDLSLEVTAQDPAAKDCWVPVFEDPAPQAFNFIPVQPGGRDCGIQELPPYTTYENTRALPRAFVVPEAAPLPDRAQVLSRLKTTDFRQLVLLENYDFTRTSSPATGSFRPVTVCDYQPNQVTLELNPGDPGYLVLTDIWFPGWTCTVDGRPTPIYRANFLFRGVELPAGAREVKFTFAPPSYLVGKAISMCTGLFVVGLSLIYWFILALPAIRLAEPERTSDAVLC
jgi:hypothetical protein